MLQIRTPCPLSVALRRVERVRPIKLLGPERSRLGVLLKGTRVLRSILIKIWGGKNRNDGLCGRRSLISGASETLKMPPRFILAVKTLGTVLKLLIKDETLTAFGTGRFLFGSGG